MTSLDFSNQLSISNKIYFLKLKAYLCPLILIYPQLSQLKQFVRSLNFHVISFLQGNHVHFVLLFGRESFFFTSRFRRSTVLSLIVQMD